MADARLLITGASGFVGGWTLRHWRSAHPDCRVWTAGDRPCPPAAPLDRDCRIDLRDADAVRRLVGECRPTHVMHLAGLIGNAALADHLAVNVAGTENLYLALAETDEARAVRIVQAGSAAIYGLVRPEELPVTESQPLRPVGAYALSKAAQDMLAAAMFRTHGLQTIRARAFNIVGPGQPDRLVPMTFIRQIDRLPGGGAALKVGNLKPRRDFVDVRDVAAALVGLLETGQPGRAYNVGTEKDWSVGEVIDLLLDIAGCDAKVEVDAGRVRAVDVPCVRSDCSRIAAAIGWRARIPLDESLRDMWQARGN